MEKKKNSFVALKELHASFPKAFIDDFASPSKGVHYEVIEDHLKNAAGLTSKQIANLRKYLQDREKEENNLAEAVSDIAYTAGEFKWHSGNGVREDINTFITWAKEFCHLTRGVEWGLAEDSEGEERFYVDEIYTFAIRKMEESKKK